jgi:hypothetical protein
MNTKRRYMKQIIVFFCKDFPEVVRKMLSKEPIPSLETLHSFVEGVSFPTDKTAITGMTKESWDFIDIVVANGYTVTAFVRAFDFCAFVPFTDDPEKSAAMAVNEKILAKFFPKAHLI